MTRSRSSSDEELLGQCRIETFRSGGPGGQHRNKTDSGVRLTHLPTGIVVAGRESRSQHRNRMRALDRLRAALQERERRPAPRRPTQPSPAAREKRLDAKRRRSAVKEKRRRPEEEEKS